jgi:hypothetical protein
MNRKLVEICGFWAMGLLLLIATLIIIRWMVDFVTWSALDSGWAQAIGSVAAILVAIWIARRDFRVRHHEALRIAQISATAIIHDVRTKSIYAKEARDVLIRSRALGYPPTEINYALSFIQFQEWWGVDDIVKLAPLANDNALYLAQAQSLIRDAIALMGAGIWRHEQQNSFEQVFGSIGPAIDALGRAIELLDISASEMAVFDA